jgi:hypothetical protein
LIPGADEPKEIAPPLEKKPLPEKKPQVENKAPLDQLPIDKKPLIEKEPAVEKQPIKTSSLKAARSPLVASHREISEPRTQRSGVSGEPSRDIHLLCGAACVAQKSQSFFQV